MNESSGHLRSDTEGIRRVLDDCQSFKSLVDAVPVQIVAKSAAPSTFGRYVLWNRVAEEWLGFRDQEVLGKTDHDLFSQEQADFFAAKDRAAIMAGKPIEIAEELVETRHRKWRTLRTTRYPIYDGERRPLAIFAVSEDITEARRREKEVSVALGSLLAERDLYSSLLMRLPVGIFARSVRPEQFGRTLLWNPSMEELTGLPAEKALGNRYADYLDPAGAVLIENEDRSVVASGEAFSTERAIASPTAGGDRLLRVTKVPLFDERGDPDVLLGLVEDLGSDDKRLLSLVHALPIALFEARSEPGGEVRMSYVSEGIERLVGLASAEFRTDPSTACRLIDPDDASRIARLFDASRDSLTEFDFEVRIRRPDGDVCWLSAHIVPRRNPDGSILWDGLVSQRSEQRCCLDSDERWGLALSNGNIAVWEWDIPKDQVSYSDGWKALLGYASTELPCSARQLLEYVHPIDRAYLRSQMIKHLKGKTSAFQCEYRLRDKASNYRWVLAQGRARFDNNQYATRMSGTLIDASERRELERKLLDARNEAEAANQAKRDFAARLDDQARAPVNKILGVAELLAASSLSPEQKELVQMIRECGASLDTALSNDFAASRIDRQRDVEKQPTHLRIAAQAVVDFFAPQVRRKGLSPDVRFAEPVPGAARVRQVLLDFLNNASRFTAGGAVHCEVYASRADGDAPGCVLDFSVVDSGTGISEPNGKATLKSSPQIEPLAARRIGGAGLGLAIVKCLAELVGGDVEVRSAADRRTSLRVRLPNGIVERGPSIRRLVGPVEQERRQPV